MTSNRDFAALVSLACHDLRTPLATVHGFARTIERAEALDERSAMHVQMIRDASADMAELLEQVALVARIEGGRYDPQLEQVDSLELARAAAERAGDGVAVDGSGEPVKVPVEATERALASLASCALRHGGLDEVRLDVRGAEIVLSPTTPESRPVLTGEELRDLGAAAALRLVEHLGGSLSLEADSLVVRLAQ